MRPLADDDRDRIHPDNLPGGRNTRIVKPVAPVIARTIEALTFLELELEDSAPIDRLRLLALVRQALADLASLEVPAQGC